MKTSVKILLPVMAFALASAGAVSSNSAKVNKVKSTSGVIIPAFIQNPSSTSCLDVTADCSTTNTHVNCMSIEQPAKRAYLKNSLDRCATELWQNPQ
nr:DUF6520 family protein [Flavobacterium potami]